MMLAELWRDLRYSIRALRHDGAFTVTALLTLSITIGAAVGMFSLVDALLLRELHVSHPEQLVKVSTVFRTGLQATLSVPMLRELTRRQDVFSSVIGSAGDSVYPVEIGTQLQPAAVRGVTANFFRDLGVKPAAGRLFVDTDVNLDTFTGAPVAVLSYSFWQQRFGSNPDAIGQSIKVQGFPFTVVGVTPRGFTGLEMFDSPTVTIPLTSFPAVFRSGNVPYATASNILWMNMAARLRPGRSLGQARAQLESVWPGIKRDIIPLTHAGAQRENFLAIALRVMPLATGEDVAMRQRFAHPLTYAFVISLLVVLIASVNLASLILPRVARRRHELAVRMAMGASRGQALRQVLVEIALLVSVAGVLGVMLGYWSSTIVAGKVLRPSPVPISLNLSLDLRVVAFATAVAGAVALVLALATLVTVRRGRLLALLQLQHRTMSPAATVGQVLIGSQMVLTVVMLTNAGLLVRSFQRLVAVRPGIATTLSMALFNARPESGTRPDSQQYFPDLIARTEALPGVRHAAISELPILSGSLAQPVSLMASPAADGIPAAFNAVSPQFFQTLGVTIEEGRDFSWADRADAARVAIISRGLARQLFPHGNALGGRIRIGAQPYRQDLQIVGVVADARLYDIKDSQSYAAFVPALQYGEATAGGFLFAAGTHVTAAMLDRVIRSAGSDYAVRVERGSDLLDRADANDQMMASMAGVFGVLTLVLATIGVAGLLAYMVAQRRREMAIRLALGADRRRILRLIMRRGAVVTTIGALIGVAAAALSTRVVAALLFGVTPHDPVVLVGAPLVLIGASLAGSVFPALHAAATNPAIALHAE